MPIQELANHRALLDGWHEFVQPCSCVANLWCWPQCRLHCPL